MNGQTGEQQLFQPHLSQPSLPSISLIQPGSTSVYLYSKLYSTTTSLLLFPLKPPFDLLPLEQVNSRTLEPYKLICVDLLIRYQYSEEEFLEFLDLFSSSQKVLFLFHDQHPFTFSSRINANRYNQPPTSTQAYTYLASCFAKLPSYNLLSRYDGPEWKLIRDIHKEKIRWQGVLPWHIDTQVYQAYNEPKRYDLGIFFTPHPFYPCRMRIFQILRKLSSSMRIFLAPPQLSGEQRARAMAQCWIALHTQTQFRYLESTFFEISASRTLLVADLDSDGKNIWKDNYVPLNLSLSDQEIERFLIELVKRKEHPFLQSKAQRMYDVIRNEFSPQNYSSSLQSIFTTILKPDTSDPLQPILNHLLSLPEKTNLSSKVELSLPTEPPPSILEVIPFPQPNINQYFDQIYVLNLDRSVDRWLKVKTQLDRHQITKYLRFSAIDGYKEPYRSQWDRYRLRMRGDIKIKSPGAWGHLNSFIAILEDAKKHSYKRILFLEDDIICHKQFSALFQRIELPHSWKLLYLGANDHGFASRKLSPPCNYKSDQQVYGTFALGIDHQVFDLIQNVARQFLSPSDGNPLFAVMEKYPDECKIIYPNLIIADVTTSTIRNGINMLQQAQRVGWTLPMYV